MSEVILPPFVSFNDSDIIKMSQKRKMPEPVFKITKVERPFLADSPTPEYLYSKYKFV